MLRIGDFAEKLTGSDRLVVKNAAGQTIYRGFAGNYKGAMINPNRLIKSFGMGMETYLATETMADWKNIEKLPEQIPFESIPEYQTQQLNHIIYTEVTLESEFGGGSR